MTIKRPRLLMSALGPRSHAGYWWHACEYEDYVTSAVYAFLSFVQTVITSQWSHCECYIWDVLTCCKTIYFKCKGSTNFFLQTWYKYVNLWQQCISFHWECLLAKMLMQNIWSCTELQIYWKQSYYDVIEFTKEKYANVVRSAHLYLESPSPVRINEGDVLSILFVSSAQPLPAARVR